MFWRRRVGRSQYYLLVEILFFAGCGHILAVAVVEEDLTRGSRWHCEWKIIQENLVD